MGIVTTGTDVLAETEEFNRGLAERLADVPEPHEVDDVARLREPGGAFPEPVVLDEGRDLELGGVPVRVFAPSEPPEPRGVYVHLHGGGGVLGSNRTQDVALHRLAEDTGLTVVSADYRLAPEHPHPAAVDDVEAVLRAVLRDSDVVLGGESFGGWLAVLALLRLRERSAGRDVRAVYLAYPLSDLSLTPSARRFGNQHLVTSTEAERWFHAQLCPGPDTEGLRDPSVSPLYADLTGLPPARIVVGTRDPLLDDSLFLAARWSAAGNAVDLEVVDGAVHGFTAFPLTVAEREAEAKVVFLRSQSGQPIE